MENLDKLVYIVPDNMLMPELVKGDKLIVDCKQTDFDGIGLVLIRDIMVQRYIFRSDKGLTVGYSGDTRTYTNKEIEELPIVVVGKVIELRRAFNVQQGKGRARKKGKS